MGYSDGRGFGDDLINVGVKKYLEGGELDKCRPIHVEINLEGITHQTEGEDLRRNYPPSQSFY
jgi:hypothetical protein